MSAEFPFGPHVHAPPFDDASRARLRTIIRVQLRAISLQDDVPCGACGGALPVRYVYRCYHCGVYVCGGCGDAHFGARPA